MWDLIDRRIQLTIIIGVGVLFAWAADALYALIFGNHPGILKWVSLSVTVVGTVLAWVANASWRWLWRKVPALSSKFFPDLNGVWTGYLISTWKKPGTNEALAPIPATITIRQGLFGTSVSLKTGESTSHSTRAFLEPFRDTNRYRVWYSYNNDPQAQHRHRSSPHEGVAFLEVDLDADPNRLEGRYYTARKTTGDMTLTRTLDYGNGMPSQA